MLTPSQLLKEHMEHMAGVPKDALKTLQIKPGKPPRRGDHEDEPHALSRRNEIRFDEIRTDQIRSGSQVQTLIAGPRTG